MKRITAERLKKAAISLGIVGTPLAIFLITYLLSLGVLTIGDYDYTERCGGNEICQLNLYEVCFNEDVFIYPMNGTWMLNITPPDQLEWLKLYRGWGSGLREIKLDTECRGSWCGCYWCTTSNTAKYVYAFREDKCYNLTYMAKKDEYTTIHFEFNPEGDWGPNKKRIRIVDGSKYKIIYWNVTIDHAYHVYNCTVNITGKGGVCGKKLTCKIGEDCNGYVKHNYTIETRNKSEMVWFKQYLELYEDKFDATAHNLYCIENAWNNITCDSLWDGNGDGIITVGESGIRYFEGDKKLEYNTKGYLRWDYKSEMKDYNTTEKVSLSAS